MLKCLPCIPTHLRKLFQHIGIVSNQKKRRKKRQRWLTNSIFITYMSSGSTHQENDFQWLTFWMMILVWIFRDGDEEKNSFRFQIQNKQTKYFTISQSNTYILGNSVIGAASSKIIIKEFAVDARIIIML